jgi:LytR cell envelope-related transcriptional attenuator
VGYLSESPLWRKRRRRRQRITMTVIVLLVLAVGVGAYGYEQGWLAQPAEGGAVAVLPTCPPPTAHPLTPADVRVNVYNSTSRNGLASTVAEALGKRSFVVETVANDPLHADVTGTALVRYGRNGAEAAKLVKAQVPRAAMHLDKRKNATVDLVLGDAFRRLSPAAAPATTPAGPTPTPAPTCTPAGTPTSPTSSASPTG